MLKGLSLMIFDNNIIVYDHVHDRLIINEEEQKKAELKLLGGPLRYISVSAELFPMVCKFMEYFGIHETVLPGAQRVFPTQTVYYDFSYDTSTAPGSTLWYDVSTNVQNTSTTKLDSSVTCTY